MSNLPLKHVIFVPAPSWGHLRPALSTALRMAEKFQDLFISLYVYDSEIPKATKYFNAQSSEHSVRVRIVSASGSEAPPVSIVNPIQIIKYLEDSFGSWIARELKEPTAAPIQGRPIEKPSWIIEDYFNGGVSVACKDVHGLPIAAWWTTTAASLIGHVGNKDNGHGGRIFEYLSQHPDFSFEKAGDMFLEGLSDRLISIPGIPVHHEWELFPQYVPFLPPFATYMFGRWSNMLKHIDTVACCTTFEMEPISGAALGNGLDKPLTTFFIGPAVDLVSLEKPDPSSPITQFLDNAHTEKGAHSVIYIAFGSAFFPPPTSLSHLTAAIDEIPKAGLKFVFALSSPSAKLDQSWMDAHVQAGNGIFPEWTNQTAVLEHPAIHYFLSHGGWNSAAEALVRGVPMIFWPIAGDQPQNALQIATIHDCGFELLQIRTGPAKSTAYQNGAELKIIGTDDAVREEMKHLLKLSRGPRGEHQRKNIKLLAKVITNSLALGGSGDLDLERFGKVVGL
ncbi:UDP-glycosyltransferase 74C1 OS=Arabidopsis thaliana GN=UGT74C1 PE=2 SV=1 [Rhizoctonia solani AG-1 IB]|uniref:UDP-glycosyltransferase 74C1 n=1 Tax=Thanatephorus cucumeris (strain AG1-IB / isolate 7/3/14) TaxID=1108050 RepID=A0A0B7FLR2_THACB|nr:UDP-glycosyltransferase 74C1 OS=Arabidopsis thaliana GN=UGT74C1 PE=2 SV=1 [Rhizoctonia solani AG-1 IB]